MGDISTYSGMKQVTIEFVDNARPDLRMDVKDYQFTGGWLILQPQNEGSGNVTAIPADLVHAVWFK